jgi:hypothetical protein
LRSQNSSGVVGVTRVVVSGGIAHWQILAIPCPIEVKESGTEAIKDDNTNQRVGNSMPRGRACQSHISDKPIFVGYTYHGGMSGEPW